MRMPRLTRLPCLFFPHHRNHLNGWIHVFHLFHLTTATNQPKLFPLLKPRVYLFVLLGAFLLGFPEPGWLSAQTFASRTNQSLGPIPLRNQFPVGQQFLHFTPETPEPTAPWRWQLAYQLAISNTFINSRGSSGDLTEEKVRRGLKNTDFFHKSIPEPMNGFNLYLDVEVYRHLFRTEYGLPFNVELGLELPIISFISGFLDRTIETVHDFTGVSNTEEEGGFRAKSPRNRFDYYLIRNDRFIYQENKPFEWQPGDPVLDLKWLARRESKWWPSVAVKWSWKVALDGADHYPRKLISSGRNDYGLYYLLGKTVYSPDYVLYLMGGTSILSSQGEDFNDQVNHTVFAFEYRYTDDISWLTQWERKSSIFPSRSKPLPDSFRSRVVDRGLGTDTDLLTVGGHLRHRQEVYHFGFAQDLNQTRNETDIVFFFGVEWRQEGSG